MMNFSFIKHFVIKPSLSRGEWLLLLTHTHTHSPPIHTVKMSEVFTHRRDTELIVFESQCCFLWPIGVD